MSTPGGAPGGGLGVERKKFDPFGNRLADLASPRLDTSAALPMSSPDVTAGFTGHEGDDELGLVNMRGRIFDPKVGKFLTADPFVQFPFFGQSYNRYAYTMGNPVNFVDPSGFGPDDIPVPYPQPLPSCTPGIPGDCDPMMDPVPDEDEPDDDNPDAGPSEEALARAKAFFDELDEEFAREMAEFAQDQIDVVMMLAFRHARDVNFALGRPGPKSEDSLAKVTVQLAPKFAGYSATLAQSVVLAGLPPGVEFDPADVLPGGGVGMAVAKRAGVGIVSRVLSALGRGLAKIVGKTATKAIVLTAKGLAHVAERHVCLAEQKPQARAFSTPGRASHLWRKLLKAWRRPDKLAT